MLSLGASSSGSEFRLFGSDDFAMSGVRMAGDFSGCTENSGNIATPIQCWNNFHPSPRFMPDWFDIFFYWAAPSGERARHAAVVPSLLNARGKGYTLNSVLSQFRDEIAPHDGTLRPFHAGATDTGDGSCLDFRTIRSGAPLLAASDCRPTWGSLGWQGSRPVDIEGYLLWADRVGDSNFAFDPWRVPDDLQRTDLYLGDFQTFGFFSDYTADALFGRLVQSRGGTDFHSYGNVVPESMGGDPNEEPTRSGWPLGLLAKMDAFTFDAPGLENTAWFQVTVTNNSREVYGLGLDYDSLYMGLLPGWLHFNGGTSLYRDPANGVVRGAPMCQGQTNSSSRGVSGNGCGPGGDPMHPAASWGTVPPSGVGAGFNYGASAIVVLKSPIGDLRNKLFTDPTSAFFGKGDPSSWDDTITFNHGHMCGFHGCSAVTWNAPRSTAPNTDYEQRQFGMVASIAPDLVGDRAIDDIANHTLWDTWRWEEYPDRDRLDFNKWVPGGWDYDEDGVADTLFFDDCSDQSGFQFDPVTRHEKKCSVTWSDTLTSGWGNVYANRGAVTGVGPFRLPADSSTGWVIAIVMASDSIAIDSEIARAIRHYLTFNNRPGPPPAPPVASVEVDVDSDSVGGFGQPEARVRLYLGSDIEEWEDRFLMLYLEELLRAHPDSRLGNLRRLNPTLEDTLRALISNNAAAIHVFKSCDGGLNFTDDDDCQPDVPNAGKFEELGWFPWRTLEPDLDGNFVNVLADEAIFRGRTYLYTFVTESRGLELPVTVGVPDSAVTAEGDTVFTCVRDCRVETLSVAPKLMSRFSVEAGDPQVARFYVPASRQAGASTARIDLLEASPDFLPFQRMGVRPTREDVRSGEYRLLFGDSVRATEHAVVEATGVTVNRTVVEVFEASGEALSLRVGGPVGVEGEFVEQTDTLEGARIRRRRTWTFGTLSAVLVDSLDRPLMVSPRLDGGPPPGRYFGLPSFPGFTLSIDNRVGGEFDGQHYRDEQGDVVSPLVAPAITYLPDLAEEPGEGRYRVVWADEAFGPAGLFAIDHSDPDGVRRAVVESLAMREAGQTASTDPDIAAFLGFPPEHLLPMRMPFRIENVTDAEDPRPVTVVMPRNRKLESILLGSGFDTLDVDVPGTEWVPGDPLMLVEGRAPDFRVTFRTAVLGCDPEVWARTSCNPLTLSSPGATGYIPTRAGHELDIAYHQTISGRTEYRFALRVPVRGHRLASQPDRVRAALDSVKVVPNPFVLSSRYSTSAFDHYIVFTHVPPRGVIRIFTLAGQFIQRIRWTPADLNGQGDLRFNLNTREGNMMAGGLYLYVLIAIDDQGRKIGTKKGKFVLIR